MRPLVLVVDIASAARRIIRALLASKRYGVLEAGTGAEALRRAARERPDVLVVELDLPDFDGVELVRRLQEVERRPRRHPLDPDRRAKHSSRALDGGADDYLAKPFRLAELAARVRVALRRASRSPGIFGGAVAIGTPRVRRPGSSGGLRRTAETSTSRRPNTRCSLSPF